MSGADRPESTFADVLNGLTMGRHRKRANETRPAPEPVAAQPDAPADEPDPVEENAASVRAYAWTAGRTRSSGRLEIETLIVTAPRAEELFTSMRVEHQSVARLCRQTRSVAEIGALLHLPIGVVRVLLDDMAGLGLVTVHHNESTPDARPDIDLMRRVLRGLANLRT
ncbi:DUF742 domain-containing protein [Actinophytocola algeriensis]|uniref:DUF742 domain-containing protein n=1 Tax=Actinophytocola algeriensis TaxID=1768010 RepID=A0A7W7VEY4_9PSEU|nr:DUF742 domain-containing protein [Actinophytocola algeriensis]MBB4907741.1 hypothetical protein [Actinophytocola algeriensis]MBE1479771.1 hypothetical protein [Actinophytocola algeriensis]